MCRFALKPLSLTTKFVETGCHLGKHIWIYFQVCVNSFADLYLLIMI